MFYVSDRDIVLYAHTSHRILSANIQNTHMRMRIDVAGFNQ